MLLYNVYYVTDEESNNTLAFSHQTDDAHPEIIRLRLELQNKDALHRQEMKYKEALHRQQLENERLTADRRILLNELQSKDREARDALKIVRAVGDGNRRLLKVQMEAKEREHQLTMQHKESEQQRAIRFEKLNASRRHLSREIEHAKSENQFLQDTGRQMYAMWSRDKEGMRSLEKMHSNLEAYTSLTGFQKMIRGPYDPSKNYTSSDIVEEPSIGEPSFEQPSIKEPIFEQPSIKEPIFEQPSIKEPIDSDSSRVLFQGH